MAFFSRRILHSFSLSTGFSGILFEATIGHLIPLLIPSLIGMLVCLFFLSLWKVLVISFLLCGEWREDESLFLRTYFSDAWREALAGRDHSCGVLKDWQQVVRGMEGETALDWLEEERNRPSHLRTKSVFPFGERGSFLQNSLQKWTAGTPAPPFCANPICFINPCQVLASARERGDLVVWVKDNKINHKKGIFSQIIESEG